MLRILFLLFLPGFGHSQAVRQITRIGPGALAPYSAQSLQPLTPDQNPAYLSKIRQTQFSAGTEIPFFLSELSLSGFGASIPLKTGSFGFFASHAGSNPWQENYFSIAVGRHLGEQLSLGLRTGLVLIKGRNKAALAVTAEYGTILHISKEWHMGLHLLHPFRAGFSGSSGEKLGRSFRVGMGFDASKQVHLGGMAYIDEDASNGFIFGITYQPIPSVFTECQLNTDPGNWTFSLGLQTGKHVWKLGSTTQMLLGWSPFFQFHFFPGNKKIHEN